MRYLENQAVQELRWTINRIGTTTHSPDSDDVEKALIMLINFLEILDRRLELIEDRLVEMEVCVR